MSGTQSPFRSTKVLECGLEISSLPSKSRQFASSALDTTMSLNSMNLNLELSLLYPRAIFIFLSFASWYRKSVLKFLRKMVSKYLVVWKGKEMKEDGGQCPNTPLKKRQSPLPSRLGRRHLHHICIYVEPKWLDIAKELEAIDFRF